jgi:hypothetical protein
MIVVGGAWSGKRPQEWSQVLLLDLVNWTWISVTSEHVFEHSTIYTHLSFAPIRNEWIVCLGRVNGRSKFGLLKLTLFDSNALASSSSSEEESSTTVSQSTDSWLEADPIIVHSLDCKISLRLVRWFVRSFVGLFVRFIGLIGFSEYDAGCVAEGAGSADYAANRRV